MRKKIYIILIILILSGTHLPGREKIGFILTRGLEISSHPHISGKENRFSIDFALSQRFLLELGYLYQDSFSNGLIRRYSHNYFLSIGYRLALTKRISLIPKAGIVFQEVKIRSHSVLHDDPDNPGSGHKIRDDDTNWIIGKRGIINDLMLGFEVDFQVSKNTSFYGGYVNMGQGTVNNNATIHVGVKFYF